jgi:hypothetical protein
MPSHARRIVVAIDGSNASRRALDAAADLVGYAASLSVVHVRTADMLDNRAVERAREHLLRRHVLRGTSNGSGVRPRRSSRRRARPAPLVIGRRNSESDDLGSISSRTFAAHRVT